MVRRKLVWSPESIKDRNQIFHFWNKRNKSNEYRRRLSHLFRFETRRLFKAPEIGKPTKVVNLRILFVEHFTFIYHIKQEDIEIVNVWDGCRNPNDFEKLTTKR